MTPPIRLKKLASWLTNTRLVPVGAPVLIVIMITLAVAFYWYQADEMRYQILFDGHTRSLFSVMEEEFNDYQEVVQMLASHYSTNRQPDREDFNTFVKSSLVRHSGLQALEWVPRVKASERLSYEQIMRDNGFENYQFRQWTPGGESDWTASDEKWADEYFPVYFMQPHAPNAGAFGIDLASNPTRRMTLEKSLDSGERMATPRIILAQGSKSQAGVLIFVPVYAPNAPTDTLEQRRKHLRGFALGVCRIGDIIESMLDHHDIHGIEVFVVDKSAEHNQQNHLYGKPASPEGEAFLQDGSARQVAFDYNLAGRRWEFTFTPTPQYIKSHHRARPWIILVVGTLIASLLGAILNFVYGRGVEIEKVVHQRTKELIESQKLLEVAKTKLQDKANVAEAATTAKSEFLANMSHEIRTPMTAILGFTDILLNHENMAQASEEWTEALRTIQKNGQNLLELINNILDISKIESGKFEIENIACSPFDILNDVITLMAVRSNAKGIYLESIIDDPIPATIQSDPTRLRQILINLIGNAIKFTELGHVRAVVRMRKRGSHSPRIEFHIEDTGIGMTEEQRENLFQPFAQADTSTTRKFGGTGLGLTISKRLANRLGGDIEVQSSMGRGSTFILSIEAEILDGVAMISQKPDSLKAAKEKEKEAPIPHLDCRVLLAEDGPDNQRLLSFILKKAGAEVVVAENGKIALDLALEADADGNSFDVILMDMQMPIMDGYTATQNLREAGYPLPIIALTAHAMSSDREKCCEAGCDDYMTKPIDRRALIAMVAQYAAQGAAPLHPG